MSDDLSILPPPHPPHPPHARGSAVPVAIALGLASLLAPLQVTAQVTISGAGTANVSTTTFDLFWQVSGPSVPVLEVFADAAAETAVAGQLAVEAYPLRAGDIPAGNTAPERAGRRALRAQAAARQVALVRVSGAAPGTTYYVRPGSRDAAGNDNAAAGAPLLEVTTATGSAFLSDAPTLAVDFSPLGGDVDGALARLVVEGAGPPLVAVVGDGGAGKATFHLAELLTADGTTHLDPGGTRRFAIEIIGRDLPAGTVEGDVAAAGTFTVARNTSVPFELIGEDRAASFAVEALTAAVEGLPFRVSITALDREGQPVEAFVGGVTLSSDAPALRGLGQTPPLVGGVLADHPIVVNQAGDFTLEVTAEGSGRGTLAFTVGEAGFEGFKDYFFTPEEQADPSVSGPFADRDGDGIPNIAEYALRLDPRRYDAGGGSRAEMRPENGQFRLRFRRARRAPGTTVRVQFSSNLQGWNSNEVTETVMEDTGDAEEVEASVPVNNRPVLFGRLQLVVSP